MRVQQTLALALVALACSISVPAAAQVSSDALEHAGEEDVAPQAAAGSGDVGGSRSVIGPERKRWHPWFAVLLHVSLISDRLSASSLNIRFGYGVTVGARRGPWGVYGHLEHNIWTESEFDFALRSGTLNLAVGGERFLFEERLRLAVAVGTSVLLSSQAIHTAPHFGLFVQVKPIGIRLARESQVLVVLDPISLTVVAPVLGSISLVDLQYRTTIGVEWQGVR